jgi:tRNA (guanine37-N1)-methyltransferase
MKLKAILHQKLAAEELNELVRGYDVVGDIAIIIVPPLLEHKESLIGAAILDSHPKVRVVAKRVGNYSGEHRTIALQIIAGENRKETVHKEFGIRFRLNPELVYFSVRSSTERKRIADLVSAGERVLVMFSGIAPYPLYIRTFSDADSIAGVETNPDAHRYALENITLNKTRERITLYHGDVRDIVPRLRVRFDRIVMPLPHSGSEYLPLALDHLNHGGHLHHYVMQRPESLETSILELASACRDCSRELLSLKTIVCGHTGPNRYRYCIDAVIR